MQCELVDGTYVVGWKPSAPEVQNKKFSNT